jgi:hypothetical protein
VRGFECLLACPAQYLFKNAINIPQDVIVPKAQNEITAVLQILGSKRVSYLLVGVLTAIEFDDEFSVRAAEIDNEPLSDICRRNFKPPSR